MSKHPELDALLDKARAHVMTDEEIFEQRVSWVYGEMQLAGHDVSKDEIRANLRRMAPLRPDHTDKPSS